jgi:cathepsin L
VCNFVIVCLVALTLCCTLVSSRSEVEYIKAWLDFTSKYQKTYAHDEVHMRYKIFKKNVDFIDNHNNGTSSFTLAINQFADLSNAEFQKLYLGTKVNSKARLGKTQEKSSTALPTSWDWRTKGAVTPVKNQQQCGSCWAFSTTGSTEGCHFLTTGKLVSLSEQNLVDCSSAQGNEGCNGGLMDSAFQYIISNKGIDTEQSYPYTAETGESCNYKASSCGSTVASFTDVTSGDENALQQAVSKNPVSIAIDASQDSFQFYSTGVYSDASCSSTQLDHGVLAIGWGVDSSTPYWLVKNSWGTTWGQEGYIWMKRNANNMCGVATMASYPSNCGNCH